LFKGAPVGARFVDPSDEQPFIASMGIYVFTRDVLLDALDRQWKTVLLHMETRL